MNKSLFMEYVEKIFPKLATLIEKVNGKRKAPTYLHKTMLRKVYSPDNKWSTASVDSTFVSADMVALDSPLPPKKRDSVATANGVLPKIGMKKRLSETDINTINIMKAQGGNFEQIANKLTADAIACSNGIDEKMEAALLEGLSEGCVAITDIENGTNALRIDFGYLPENQFGVSEAGTISYDDIKRVITTADEAGVTITTIALAQSTYNRMRQTQWAKELVANYRGLIISADSVLPTPTASVFDEAFADDNNGIKFLKIDRSVIRERNGVRESYKPFNSDKLVFLASEEVGALIWGQLAEKTNPVQGVVYSTVDGYKLISKYSKNDPLEEFTSGQAMAIPVIENVDQIFVLDLSDAEGDEQEEGDATITLFGDSTLLVTDVITAFNAIEGVTPLPDDATDAEIVSAVNKLSKAKEAKLKELLEIV